MLSISKNFFFFPILISLIVFAGIGLKLGLEAMFLVIILSILEVTLSFDNAVVNARVLERMSPVWQRRFLTWGIIMAVFGTRFVLPILIVSVALFMSPLEVLDIVVTDPEKYGHLLESVHGAITAFGGVFLLMVALKYFFNRAKDIHWIRVIEAHLVKWGRIEAIEIALALVFLVTLSFFTPFEPTTVLVSGIVGLVLFILMQGITGTLSIERGDLVRQGGALFLYLEILDTAFSLDGVIGAFALSSNLFIIAGGLGIGAYFVRSLTLYLVERKTLVKLVYLEHGAHWAIFGLAIAMLANLVIHVPEIVTGLIGLCFVLLAYRSSLRDLYDR
jgi:uncharacterized protein